MPKTELAQPNGKERAPRPARGPSEGAARGNVPYNWESWALPSSAAPGSAAAVLPSPSSVALHHLGVLGARFLPRNSALAAHNQIVNFTTLNPFRARLKNPGRGCWRPGKGAVGASGSAERSGLQMNVTPS